MYLNLQTATISAMKKTLEHLPKNKQANIHTLVDILHDEFEQVRGFAKSDKKKHCRISMIILFGSYAKGSYVDDPQNGFISDYDIVVVLNSIELVEEYKIWHTAEERITQKLKAPVNILVHTHADINEWLSQGHYFFSDIRAEGIQLYQYNNAELIEPSEISAEEAKEIAQKHFEQWFESAGRFLINAKENIDKSWHKEAAFMLHQATERYLSCILLVFTNYRPKSHNLSLLNGLASQHADKLHTIFPQESKHNRRCFELLKRAYIDSRYSEHYSIDEEELSWLVERVQCLQLLAEELCREKILGFVVKGVDH